VRIALPGAFPPYDFMASSIIDEVFFFALVMPVCGGSNGLSEGDLQLSCPEAIHCRKASASNDEPKWKLSVMT